ncbi:hypothetical protein [uncultured Psychroserpens sp.]|uniref:hypothetical protein n=1 Tax=uncultured Psychroserpens sp. TaxID=255436 RepID=UPI0026187B04|nr:hypothetical protein [uncultured Psychroserpens sp.]
MDKLKLKSKRKSESSCKTAKPKKLNRNAVVGSIIGTLIASTPLLWSLHESVPTEKVWNTFLFTYDSKFWEDAQYAMWVFTGKFIPLFLLLIWFFTNRNWWYHALLVPIVMYSFQIVLTFKGDTTHVDEFQIIYMLPIMAIVIPSIYLIRAKMFNKINDADKTMQELEEEFMMKPKGLWDKVKQYF